MRRVSIGNGNVAVQYVDVDHACIKEKGLTAGGVWMVLSDMLRGTFLVHTATFRYESDDTWCLSSVKADTHGSKPTYTGNFNLSSQNMFTTNEPPAAIHLMVHEMFLWLSENLRDTETA